MDWASRKVLSWRLSNTLDAHFCVEALHEALEHYGPPEIFNSDQGSQFTSVDFTDVLKEAGIRISMDGKGRWMDNVFVHRAAVAIAQVRRPRPLRPDSTTLSRRRQQLRRRLRLVPPGESIPLVLDSPGLSVVGAGEWAAATQGGRGRRGWRKLHRGVDPSGGIRVHTLTEATGDDATPPSIGASRSRALSCASPRTPPLTRSPSTRPPGRGGRRASSHRLGRRPSLATARGRPRGIERSR